MGAYEGLLHTIAHNTRFVLFTILQICKSVKSRIHSATCLRFAQIKSGATPASIKAEDAMRTGINHLFIPGPTNVPERVRQSMNVPMQDHRAHDFGAPNKGIFRDL